MTVKWFRQNTIGALGWESEAMGSVVWVQCTNLCRSTDTDMLESKVHHGSKINKYAH